MSGYSFAQTKKSAPAKSSASPVEKIYFNGGFHTEFYDALQIDKSGTQRKIDFAPTLGLGMQLPIAEEFKFLPEFNWVLPRDVGSKIIRNLFMFRADLGYDPLEWLRLRVGTSLMWLNQQGRGGTANINNGNEVSTFYYPDENRSSLNNTFDLGVEGRYDNWARRLQTYTYALFNSERRQVSYTLFLTYYWGL